MKMLFRFYDKSLQWSLILFLAVLHLSCEEQNILITSGNLSLEINSALESKISNTEEGSLDLITGFTSSEWIELGEKKVVKFDLANNSSESFEDSLSGKKYTVTGEFNEGSTSIKKTTVYKVYDDFPGLISTQVTYTNNGEHDEHLRSWSNNDYTILGNSDTLSFWAFQGSSTGARKDWIRPLESGYYDKNFMGMNSSDYGGGIPITDIWRKDQGIAIGHLALKPKLVSLPTEIPLGKKDVQISVKKHYEHPTLFAAGESLETLETFVSIHHGDYYNSLSQYSKIMEAKGIKMLEPEPASFETIWCGWGYGRTFTADEILGTLPKVKEMGIKWVVLDDGFQQAEGDWNADTKKYPRGNKEITELVDRIHDLGMKAKVWWTPLAIDPTSKVLKETPEMRLFQSDWSPQFITWWDAYYQAPVNPHTTEHTKKTIDLFLNEYGFDGFKMDGQHMNSVLPDHNPASNLDYPEQASEGLPDYFQMIYDESRKIKPNAVIENCPCGTCMSFFNMPSMNQAVSSDPTSLWQVRHKGKTYKALIPKTAYYADHIEVLPFMGDYNAHFATAIGIGAVPGTKFTWPKDNPNNPQGEFLLTSEKEEIWLKWFQLYEETMLSKEEYLGNLYDIGFDKPEAHVIKKGQDLYYSFYSDEWDGDITFKGLDIDSTYQVLNYVTGEKIGSISGNSDKLNLSFKNFLLVKVVKTL